MISSGRMRFDFLMFGCVCVSKSCSFFFFGWESNAIREGTGNMLVVIELYEYRGRRHQSYCDSLRWDEH